VGEEREGLLLRVRQASLLQAATIHYPP
jgi:hypothetical protein